MGAKNNRKNMIEIKQRNGLKKETEIQSMCPQSSLVRVQQCRVTVKYNG